MAEDGTEPCIGYCDPTGVGIYPHPQWPFDKICEECLLVEWREHMENTLTEWIDTLGEDKVKELIGELI